MLAELLHTASLMDQATEALSSIDHKSGFRFLNSESDLFESMENMRRQLADQSKIDCYTLNSEGLQYKLGDLACDERQIWACVNESQCNSYQPGSVLGFDAWEPFSGVPNPTHYKGIELDYQEPSESDLINMINRIPLESHMSVATEPFVLNMSLQEYWNCFYDDYAPFFVNKFLEDAGDELIGEATNWQDPSTLNKSFYTDRWGYDLKSYRTFDAKVYVDGNPLSDHMQSHINMLLLDKSDSSIVSAEVIESSGMMYSERFQVIAKVEVFTPSPLSR